MASCVALALATYLVIWRIDRAKSKAKTDAASAAGDRAVTLDPADWQAFSHRAHDLLDRLIGQLEHAAEGPVWRQPPDSVRARLAEPIPLAGQGLERVLADVAELVLPYGTGNTHPRFWGWVHGCGTPSGMLAEMAAAALNANCGGRDHGAIAVEACVLDWARQWFGLPKDAGGVLVGGTSTANLLALTAARNHHAGGDIRADGLQGARLVGYCSAEGHSCLAKAFEILGLGRRALRRIAVDSEYRIDQEALAAAIATDRAAGLTPFCVIGTAGTVNTGAIDDLTGLAEVCRREGLWLHVDGAFGALIALAPELAPRLAGIERADSIGFDFHKWLHVPYDAGCVLLRDGALLRATFSTRPAYLGTAEGLASGEFWPCDYGIELSRGFRALKIWLTVKEHGTARLGEAIANNCRQARLLATLIGERPDIEVLAPVSLQIVCCRYHAADMAEDQLDRLNARLVAELQLRGIAAPSTTEIGGRLCIRVSITNHRTQDADLHLLVKAIGEIGEELVATLLETAAG